MLSSQLIQGFQGFSSNATSGGVQDTQQIDVVVMVGTNSKVADNVLNFLPLEKA